MVTLIDIASFQACASWTDRLFFRPARTPDFTPPKPQSNSSVTAILSPARDQFALAVPPINDRNSFGSIIVGIFGMTVLGAFLIAPSIHKNDNPYPQAGYCYYTSPATSEPFASPSQVSPVPSEKSDPAIIVPPPSVAFSPDGRYIVAKDSAFTVWNVKTGQLKQTLYNNPDTLVAPVFSPDGKYIAARGSVGHIIIWNLETGGYQWAITLSETVTAMDWSSDDKLVVGTGGGEHYGIRWWRGVNGSEEHYFEQSVGEGVSHLRFSPDGTELASIARRDGSAITLRDANSGETKRTLRDTGNFTSLAYSGDGATLAGGGTAGITLWDTRNGERKRVIPTENRTLHAVAITPNGKTLASVNSRGIVELWDAQTGKQRLRMENGTHFDSVVFSPDGKTLLTGSATQGAQLWDAQTGKKLRDFRDSNASPAPTTDASR